jgi:hypothetical protein
MTVCDIWLMSSQITDTKRLVKYRKSATSTAVAAVLAILVLGGDSKAQTAIAFGETKVNQPMTAAQESVFTFAGTAGQLISIQMTEISGDFNPTFDLLSPTGQVLQTKTDVSASRLAFFSLPASGTYRIICRDSRGIFGGAYNLTLIDCLGENLADVDRGLIVSGQIKTAAMVASDFDLFAFEAAADVLVTIQLTEISGDFNPTFDLVSPSGQVLETRTDVSAPRLASLPLPAAGTYRIICRDSRGIFGGGYRLSITLIPIGDGDSLPDAWELQYFGSLQYAPADDPDNDRLTNAEELALKTDPSKADTDGDGFKDGVETTLRSDPLDANSKPSTDLRIFVKSVDIEFVALAGYRYQLQATADHSNWINLGDAFKGDNSLFRTNIDVRGSHYNWFTTQVTVAP